MQAVMMPVYPPALPRETFPVNSPVIMWVRGNARQIERLIVRTDAEEQESKVEEEEQGDEGDVYSESGHPERGE